MVQSEQAGQLFRIFLRRLQLIEELRQMAGELEDVAEEGESVRAEEPVEPEAERE